MPYRRPPVLFTLAAALMLLTPSANSAEAEVNCAVEAVDGPDASLWSNGAWTPLILGLAIPRDAIVLTGEATRARIECSDGLLLTVGVATQINLETLDSRRESRVAQLVKGVLGVLSPRRARETFLVRTPAAEAAVRDAETLVEVAPDKGAAVFVRRGEAQVAAGDGQNVTLTDGEGVTVDASGAAAPVKVWGDARIAKSTDALGFDWR